MNLLIVGCGSIGARYSRIVAELGATPLLVDTDGDRVSAAAAACGGIAFVSLDKALEHMPDLAIVATPPIYHKPVTERLLGRVSSLLIEKPVAPTMEDAEAIAAQERNSDTNVFVVSNMRFNPAVGALADNISAIGRVLSGSAYFGLYLPDMRPERDYREVYSSDRQQGGGATLDCIHEFDYLEWMLGAFQSVRGDILNTGTLEITGEDAASFVLRNADKALITVSLDFLQRVKQRGCRLVGEEGVLEWRSLGKAPEYSEVRLYRSGDEQGEVLFQDDAVDPNISYRKMIGAFMETVNLNKVVDPRLSTLEQGINALRVATGALQSATDDRTVYLQRKL